MTRISVDSLAGTRRTNRNQAANSDKAANFRKNIRLGVIRSAGGAFVYRKRIGETAATRCSQHR
ncbi:hypothetical protein [Planctomycetes bacterium TBK1r]|uniref:hypothetical protein n=1 Tax=Stieleria magnilauensis TaxID=2527963 RepID=UPI0011A968AD